MEVLLGIILIGLLATAISFFALCLAVPSGKQEKEDSDLSKTFVTTFSSCCFMGIFFTFSAIIYFIVDVVSKI